VSGSGWRTNPGRRSNPDFIRLAHGSGRKYNFLQSDFFQKHGGTSGRAMWVRSGKRKKEPGLNADLSAARIDRSGGAD